MSSASRLRQIGTIFKQANKSLLTPSSKLDHAITNSRQHGLPAIAIWPLHGQQLALQCRLMNAKSVLEIGTLGGYSTIWFASTGAKVTSIEVNPKHRDVALENVKGYDVNIILGSALDVLPKLAGEGHQFDYVFIDADWDHQWEYFQWAVKLTRKNGAIYVDNVVKTMLEDGVTEDGDSLLTKVGTDARVDATLITTVGGIRDDMVDSYDGYLLAVVKDAE